MQEIHSETLYKDITQNQSIADFLVPKFLLPAFILTKSIIMENGVVKWLFALNFITESVQ
jgi:hypothetical protein